MNVAKKAVASRKEGRRKKKKRRHRPLGRLVKIPIELVQRILTFLGVRELGTLQQVCTTFYDLASNEDLWQALITQTDARRYKPGNKTWKWMCQASLAPINNDNTGVQIGYEYLRDIHIGTRLGSSFYAGEWRNKMHDGVGLYTETDGDKYEVYVGQWDFDWKYGQGMKIFNALGSQTERYKGAFERGWMQGFGVYTYADKGHQYKGHFNRDAKHGFGVEKWPDGARYQGQYAYGEKHGQGRYIWADGNQYQGFYERDKQHGTGVFTWADGRKFVGEHFEGMRSDTGTYFLSDGRTWLYTSASDVPGELHYVHKVRALWFDLITMPAEQFDRITQASALELQSHNISRYLTSSGIAIDGLSAALNAYRAHHRT